METEASSFRPWWTQMSIPIPPLHEYITNIFAHRSLIPCEASTQGIFFVQVWQIRKPLLSFFLTTHFFSIPKSSVSPNLSAIWNTCRSTLFGGILPPLLPLLAPGRQADLTETYLITFWGVNVHQRLYNKVIFRLREIELRIQAQTQGSPLSYAKPE